MNFVSYAFAGLLILVCLARLTVGRRKIESSYVWVLLVASLVFYGWTDARFVWLLAASIVVNWALG